MAIDPNHALIWSRGSQIKQTLNHQTGQANMDRIVAPHRRHDQAADRERAPVMLPFTHDARERHCTSVYPGEEGRPHQYQAWVNYGPPVPDSTALLIGVVPAGGMLMGWHIDVTEGVAGLMGEIVVETFGGTHGGAGADPAVALAPVEHVIGTVDLTTQGMSYLAAPTATLTPVPNQPSFVFVENNYRVWLRITAIDDPKQMLHARFQIHTWMQELCTQAPLIDNQCDADMMQSFAGLGAQWAAADDMFD